MRVLDLFAGLGGWGAAFSERGHEVVSVDFDKRFDVTVHADVFELTAADLTGSFDVVLASPPCEAFSVLQIGRNWTRPPENFPKTEAAKVALALVEHTVRLINEVDPAFFVVENPRAKLRRLRPVAHLDRRTVTYCQYGAPSQKPTDLWGGFPPSLELAPPCSANDDCHISAPRGDPAPASKETATTTAGRSTSDNCASVTRRATRRTSQRCERWCRTSCHSPCVWLPSVTSMPA